MKETNLSYYLVGIFLSVMHYINCLHELYLRLFLNRKICIYLFKVLELKVGKIK